MLYYKKNIPSAEQSLVPFPSNEFIELPAEDIRACEETIGMLFNNELKTLYKYCTQGELLFFGMFLTSPQDIATNCKSWMDIGFIGLSENDQFYPMHPEGTIQPHYINANWLQFASEFGNNSGYVTIDYDPATKGQIGQIINSGRDQYERFVITSNITELARKVMQRVESNDIEITAEGYFCLKVVWVSWKTY
jgi:cell wall assembly regulator SMI1